MPRCVYKSIVKCLLSFSAVIPTVAGDDDEDDYVAMSSPTDVMDVADAGGQQASLDDAAASANALISNYVLAKLLGSSPASLPSGVILPPDMPLPQLPLASFPVVPPAFVEAESRPMTSAPDVDTAAAAAAEAAVGNGSPGWKVRDESSGEVDQTDDPPSLGRRADVNAAEELLVEWKGDRGQSRSVSNAANNFVVFAPLSPGHAARKPQTVSPTESPATVRSTAPVSSLRALIDKSLGKRLDRSRFDYSGFVGKSVAVQDRVPGPGNSSTVELDEFKSGPAAAEMADEHAEDIGFIARDQDYVTPVTGFHLRPRLFPAGAAQPRDDMGKTSVSVQLPPDNAPWTISEDPEPTAQDLEPAEGQLPVSDDDQNSDDTTKTGGSRKSAKAASMRESKSDVGTTDPTVHMYTVLSAAGRQPDDVSDDVRGDVRNDVSHDVEKPDIGDDATDDVELDEEIDVSDDVRDVVGLDDEDLSDFKDDASDDVREDDVEDDVSDDIRVEVDDDASGGVELDEDDAKVDVSDDVGEVDVEDDVRDDDAGSDGEDDDVEEVVRRERQQAEDDGTSPVVVQDARRLSPEFLRVMQSLWPGLEICAGPQCSGVRRTTRPADVDDAAATAAPTTPRSTEYDFPPANAWKLKFAAESDSKRAREDEDVRVSVVSTEPPPKTTTTGARDVTSPPATTPTLWQVLSSTSPRTDSAPTSPVRKLVANISADQLTLARSKSNDTAAAKDDRVKMKSDRERSKITATLSPTSTTGSGYKPPRRQRIGARGRMRSIDTRRRNGPETRRHDGPIRRLVRPFHRHPPRTDPTRRGTSHKLQRVLPPRPRHGFAPPGFSFARRPTVVRPRSQFGGLPGRRRAQTVDSESESVRGRDPALQTNEEVGRRRLGSAFSLAVRRAHVPQRPRGRLSRDRMAFFASAGRETDSLERTTTSTLPGLLTDEARTDDVSPSKTTADGRNEETARLEQIRDMRRRQKLRSSSSEEDARNEKTRLEQTTDKTSSGASQSKTDRRANARDEEGTKASKKFADGSGEVSTSAWPSEAVTESIAGAVSSTHGEIDVEASSTALTTAPTSIQPTRTQQQTTSGAQTSTTGHSTVSDRPQTAAGTDPPLAVDSGDAQSPGGSEPLPVQAVPGEHGRSAAAIAMLGGYADWMVGLISAVAVAVFIFLAILSFLAVVSCRCVSSR